MLRRIGVSTDESLKVPAAFSPFFFFFLSAGIISFLFFFLCDFFFVVWLRERCSEIAIQTDSHSSAFRPPIPCRCQVCFLALYFLGFDFGFAALFVSVWCAGCNTDIFRAGADSLDPHDVFVFVLCV